MGHEATVSKVSEDQLFYLMSRGLTEDEAMAMIVRGFVEPIATELPDGVRPRAQPAHRAADGRGRGLSDVALPRSSPGDRRVQRQAALARRDAAARRQPRRAAPRRSTSPTSPCPPAARRSGGSPRSTACAACTTDDGRRRRQRLDVEVDAAPEVERRDASAATTPGSAGRRAGRPGRGPRLVVGSSRRTVVTVPARRRSSRRRPSSPLRGDGAARRAYGHLLVERRRVRRGRRRARPRRQRRRYADNVEVVVGDGAAAHLGHRRTTGPTTPCTSPSTSVRSAATPRLHEHRRDPRRRPGPGRTDASSTPARRRRRAARPLLRRRRPAPRAPAVRRPRGAALPQHVDLQGRAAGRGRAHGLGRRRADPRRGRRAPTPTRSTATCVLTDGARADSVPNLEIETGEIVGAGHASATGRFDDEQLFYLQARGHPRRRGAPAGRARLLRRRASTRSASRRSQERLLARDRGRARAAAVPHERRATSGPARVADVADGRARSRVEVDGVPVVPSCAADGEVYAVHDECSHADVALSEGEVEGCTIECWLHGSRFDLRTGQPTGLPATEPVPVYPVEDRRRRRLRRRRRRRQLEQLTHEPPWRSATCRSSVERRRRAAARSCAAST